MGMHTYEKLRDMLCEELEEYAEKNELSAGSLEVIHKLTDTIKNIDKISIMEEDGEYSQAGDWEMEGRGNYGRGNSYANRGQHYVRGHYSREGNRGGYSERRDSRGRYSRDGGSSYDGAKEEMMEHIDEMMEAAPDDQTREMIRSFKKELKNA